uniref:Uncharacterized protein n=1 Tax=Anguilla anguilla TaxID=7936 RepID=A0A0E9V8E3_ANGAN
MHPVVTKRSLCTNDNSKSITLSVHTELRKL